MHDHNKENKNENLEQNVYLVGTPNVGKSVLFSALTDKYATVSNYPGTTVEITSGYVPAKKWTSTEKLCLVDTPGVNSLIPLSEDERVTRNMLFEHEKKTGKKPRVILVIDAKNIRRGLILAVQLAFCKIPFLVALNMMDEAVSAGVNINLKKLREILKIPVIPTIAIQKEGINELLSSLQKPMVLTAIKLKVAEKFNKYINMFLEILHPLATLSVIASDTSIRSYLNDSEITEVEKLLSTNELNLHSLQLIWRQNAEDIQGEVYTRYMPSQNKILNFLSRWSIHRYLGFPILFMAIYLIYKFVGYFGAGVGVDFLEKQVFGTYITPLFKEFFYAVPFPEFVRDLFVGQYGLLSMGLTYAIAIIFPIVLTFFIAFSFLEDSGYLPRMGALLNNFFKFMGLNGKAILPMVLGLGCDTMATMTARVMNSRKERLLVTLLLALGIPCSAQMGVIMAFSTYIPFGYVMAWGIIVVLILMFVGYLASKVLPGQSSLFLLEIPPLRIPQFKNLAMKTYIRTKWYLKEALPIFLLGTFILFVLSKLNVISFLNESLKPITTGALGLPEESAKSFIMGFLRRDFGTAGFFAMYQEGLLNPRQVLISLVVITLFIPCIANLLMIVKEQGIKVAFFIFLFIIPFAFLVGTALNYSMKIFGI